MKNFLITLLFTLASFSLAQTLDFTVTYSGGDDFAVGAETDVGPVLVGSSVLFDLQEVTVSGVDTFDEVFTYVGLEREVYQFDEASVVTSVRFGGYNPITELPTAPDLWGTHFSVGVQEDGDEINVGFLVTTEQFEEYNFGFTTSIAIGVF